MTPTAMTILGSDYMTAVDDAGNFWVRLLDVCDAFGLERRVLAKRVASQIKPEWQMMLKTPTAGGEQDTKFVNQNAIAKLAIRSQNQAVQDFADEIIDLGVRAKRGDLTVVEEIIDKRLADVDTTDAFGAKVQQLEYTDFHMQREQAKVSNKRRNAAIEARTTERERVPTYQRLSDDVNLCTTGKTGRQIRKLGAVEHTRDALSPAHLALQRFVELSQVELMEAHDAQGYNRIRGACEHLHEEVGGTAQRLGLHSDHLIRDRRRDVRLPPPEQRFL